MSPPPTAPEAATLTVRQLNRLISHALTTMFPDELWVEGEIASLRRHGATGNVYFQLADPGDGASGQADAAVPVVLLRANKEAVNRLLRRAAPAAPAPAGAPAAPGPAIRMADGVHIRIRAGIEYQIRSGRVQLRMTSIDPAHTLGRLAAERDRVLTALAAEGLLGRNAALPYPLLPTRVGLVTGGGSAAKADFLHELQAGAGASLGWTVTAVDARVQGPGADREIAAALLGLARRPVDVIALVRGGGARTDLQAFDSELLARTIAGLGVPVVTGIGHEIDTSVADALAAAAYKTPTACAAALVEQARRAVERPAEAWAAIRARAADLVEDQAGRLTDTGRRVAFASGVRLDGHAGRLAADSRRLRTASGAALVAADRRVAHLAARADAVDPRRALARGWSITRTADGALVRSPDAVDPGTALITTVAGGEITSRAEGPS
jgi:exodeoxyribonuclease VII large subunit